MIAKTKPVASTKTKPQLPLNAKLGAFVVRSQPGITLKGIHKFNVFNRAGFAVVEYCKPCSSARRFLGIESEDRDYVKSSLESYTPSEIQNTNFETVKRDFSLLLISEYQRLK